MSKAKPPRVQPLGSRRRLEQVDLPGGLFTMGSDSHYPDEAPIHRVRVDAFSIDTVAVTNEQFEAFATATAY